MKDDEFYYKGTLSQIKKEVYNESKKVAIKDDELKYTKKIQNDTGFAKTTTRERDEFENWFLDYDTDDTILDKGLDKLFSDERINFNILNSTDIIFQKVTDKDGNIYAKEIKTGLLFPISDCVIKSGNYHLDKREILSISYIVSYKYNIEYNSFSNIESLITSYNVASQNEINAYKNSFTQSKENEISNYYIKNTFSKNVIFNNNEKKVLSKKDIMSYMESIELALFKLEKINSEIAALYKNYYDYIYENKNSNIEIFTEENLAQLMNGLNLALENVKDNSNLIDYLGNLTSEYMESLGSRVEVNKLDWLMALNDIVLKNNGSISFQEKRRIISRLCLLYIFELINNTKDISELKNTYVEVNYKTILLNLMMLSEEGYIENDIDFNKEYTFEETIDLIKSIKFNNLDKNLSLNLFK